ncbi:MAG: hypothetical protein KDA75_20895 [Planctomycetaceae bacterium]|nr:hypothetical protein [Planctomycetaceae bacterium]
MGDPPHSSDLLRAADAIQQQYRRLARSQTDPIPLPQQRWEQLQRWARMIGHAEQRAYSGAARRCRARFRETLRLLHRDLEYALDDLDRALQRPGVPTLRLLYDEMRSLFDEFDQVEIDGEERELRVMTERIVLDGIDLGPFEIRLEWAELAGSHSYRVVPLDPNYPSCDDHVPHPHVQGESLCEGDGHHAISRALEQGQLGEFFVLVRQILRTYNEDSPYVALNRWNGVPCIDCGDVIAAEDSYGCDRCSERLCGDCYCCCTRCEVTLCSECVEHCSACDELACSRCLTSCAACGQACCERCLVDSLCPDCEPLPEETYDDPTEASAADSSTPPPTAAEAIPATSLPSAAAVQPDRVGEAVVPA